MNLDLLRALLRVSPAGSQHLQVLAPLWAATLVAVTGLSWEGSRVLPLRRHYRIFALETPAGKAWLENQAMNKLITQSLQKCDHVWHANNLNKFGASSAAEDQE